MNGKIGTEEPRRACLQMKSKYYTTIEDVLFLKDEGLPGGGGVACSLVPYENLQLFPCSLKIH